MVGAGVRSIAIRTSASLFSSHGCEDRLVTWRTSLFRVTQLVRICGHLPRSSATRTGVPCCASRSICAAGSAPFTMTPAIPAIGFEGRRARRLDLDVHAIALLEGSSNRRRPGRRGRPAVSIPSACGGGIRSRSQRIRVSACASRSVAIAKTAKVAKIAKIEMRPSAESAQPWHRSDFLQSWPASACRRILATRYGAVSP